MTMNENKIAYREISDASDPYYKEFLYRKDGELYAESFLKRVDWYFKSHRYKLLVAELDDKIVAHAGAYNVTAVINGKEVDWWWGVDTFAMPEVRGKGLGKGLQGALHQLPNFSSQAYSKINGNIKLRCGCTPLFHTPFVYYPCKRFFSAVIGMISKKCFGKSIPLPSFGTSKYRKLNHIITRRKKLDTVTFSGRHSVSQYAEFINANLSKFDFYIKRSPAYLDWKYNRNPSVEYVTMEIRNHSDQSLTGLLIFSEEKEKTVYMTKLRVSMILDFITSDESLFNLKDAICLIDRHFQQLGRPLDGVCALMECNYFPRFSFPSDGRPLLSTYSDTQVNKPYISYSDQDMEQI